MRIARLLSPTTSHTMQKQLVHDLKKATRATTVRPVPSTIPVLLEPIRASYTAAVVESMLGYRPPTGFMTLPRELRDLVYQQFLESFGEPNAPGMLESFGPADSISTIFEINRRLAAEPAEMLCSNIFEVQFASLEQLHKHRQLLRDLPKNRQLHQDGLLQSLRHRRILYSVSLQLGLYDRSHTDPKFMGSPASSRLAKYFTQVLGIRGQSRSHCHGS
jgi:hypothetical protein